MIDGKSSSTSPPSRRLLIFRSPSGEEEPGLGARVALGEDAAGLLARSITPCDVGVHVAHVPLHVPADLVVLARLGERLDPERRRRAALALGLEERLAERRTQCAGSGSFATASSQSTRSRSQASSRQAR